MDDDQIRNCAMDLLDELKSDRRLQDAAKVALQYLEDIDEAVLLLSDARLGCTSFAAHKKDRVKTYIYVYHMVSCAYFSSVVQLLYLL